LQLPGGRLYWTPWTGRTKKMKTSDNPSGVDKELWSWWYGPQKWKHNLEKKAAHKALDIPEDEGMQNVGNKSGMGWKELAILGAIGLGAAGIYKYTPSITQQQQQTTIEQAKPAADVEVKPVSSEFDVFFYDKDGNLIDVPHVSTRVEDD